MNSKHPREPLTILHLINAWSRFIDKIANWILSSLFHTIAALVIYILFCIAGVSLMTYISWIILYSPFNFLTIVALIEVAIGWLILIIAVISIPSTVLEWFRAHYLVAAEKHPDLVPPQPPPPTPPVNPSPIDYTERARRAAEEFKRGPTLH